MTALDIAALEADYHQRVKECSQVSDRKGFPDQEEFKTDEKLLHFYIGLNNFTVLMAVFELVAAVIPENPVKTQQISVINPHIDEDTIKCEQFTSCFLIWCQCHHSGSYIFEVD